MCLLVSLIKVRVAIIISQGLQRSLHAAFQPNNAPPLSPTDETPQGDVYLPDGTLAKFPKPQALDKAGITQVCMHGCMRLLCLTCDGQTGLEDAACAAAAAGCDHSNALLLAQTSRYIICSPLLRPEMC